MNTPSKESRASQDDSPSLLVRRHLRWGWFTLLVFLALGLGLETLHGLKVQMYLSVMNETRRLMWTLAHAHGTLFGLIHLGFAFSLQCTPAWTSRSRVVASCSFLAAGILMPAGFFLGGIWVYAGDPGLGILLVPVGGILLFVAVLCAAFSIKHFPASPRAGQITKPPASKSK